MDTIRTTKLTKYYGKSRGITDLDLRVEEGEFFGYIGPNGAGKSTTVRTLLGLINATSGEAKIFNKDIVKDRKEILSDIGYLPSEPIFHAGMKVKDVLRFSAELRGKNCRTSAAELSERLQLETNRKVEELSFGNRKKVAIVCALQHDPRLLILDEPTGGLDPLMQKEFFDILRERNAAGTTVFLSSHVLSEIQHNCSRAAIIREGRIIACDKVEALARTNAKRVSLVGELNPEGAASCAGIRDLNLGKDSASFLFSGDMRDLIELLAISRIRDLSVSEPELEEVFLHYYEKEA